MGLSEDSAILIFGRSTRIRTLDPLVPNQVRYRAALHSEKQDNKQYSDFCQIFIQENFEILLQKPTQ